MTEPMAARPPAAAPTPPTPPTPPAPPLPPVPSTETPTEPVGEQQRDATPAEPLEAPVDRIGILRALELGEIDVEEAMRRLDQLGA